MQVETDAVPVTHSVHLWLSRPMNWLYTQVRYLPPKFSSHVVCDETANLAEFPAANLVSADQDHFAWRFLGRHSWQIARRRQSYLLRRQARRYQAQLLHSHFGDRGWANIRDASRLDMKHVVTFYGYDVSRLPYIEPMWHDRYAELFRSAQLFLCEGPHMRQALVKLGCPEEKAKVHHLGIRVDEVTFRPRSWRPGEPLRVLIAGSFREKKGIPDALEALALIKTRVELEITIIGDTNTEPRSQAEKARILATIDRCDLQTRTRLLGYQPYSNLMSEAHRNHVFVSPSVTASDGDTEGGAPVSIIDMAASGMPVVSTRHCDIPEVLEHGVTGLLAEEHDIDGLARNLYWLLDNPEAWEPMVSTARRHIEQEFNATVQGHRLGTHYDRLIGHG